MARNDSVPVYSIDGESILRHVSEEEAALMFEERFPCGARKYQALTIRVHGKGKRDYLQLNPTPKYKDSNNFSPSSIPFGEMLANIGLSRQVIHSPGDEPGITPGRLSQIQGKVRRFKRGFSEKNPNPGPGRAEILVYA